MRSGWNGKQETLRLLLPVYLVSARPCQRRDDGDGYELGTLFEFSAFVKGLRLYFSYTLCIPRDGLGGRSHPYGGFHHLRLVHCPAVESTGRDGYRFPAGYAAVFDGYFDDIELSVI